MSDTIMNSVIAFDAVDAHRTTIKQGRIMGEPAAHDKHLLLGLQEIGGRNLVRSIGAKTIQVRGFAFIEHMPRRSLAIDHDPLAILCRHPVRSGGEKPMLVVKVHRMIDRALIAGSVRVLLHDGWFEQLP